MDVITISYRSLDDIKLIDFCKNNLTDNAQSVLGVFQDTDGVWKVDAVNYAYLVKCFFEAQIVTKGKLNGKLDFQLRTKTDMLQ
jgi:hypothetical protein